MKKILLTSLIIIYVNIVNSQELVSANANRYHYIINGSKSFSEPIIQPNSSLHLESSYSIGSKFSCGNFNFQSSIATQLSNAKERLRTQIVGAVQGLIAALPEILLQKIKPDLYDLYQKLMIRAEADIRFAYSSCESWKKAFREDNKGVSEIMKDAVDYDWSIEATSDTTDIYKAQQNVEENIGKNGIKWCNNEEKGGKNSKAFKPLRDVAIAGFNTLIGRNCTSENPVSRNKLSSNNENLIKYFKDTSEVKEFALEVLGDYIFKIGENGIRDGNIPQGLQGLINLKMIEIKDLLLEAVKKPSQNGARNLMKKEIYLGAPKIEYETIEALSSMDVGIRNMAIDALSNELAAAFIITKALKFKKILKAAKYIPELKKIDFVESLINQSLADLDSQMKDLLFEKQVRESFYSQTAFSIINNYNNDRFIPNQIIRKENTLDVKDGGAVYKND